MDSMTTRGYTPISIASHWILAISFAVSYLSADVKWFFWLHFLAGFVFAATLLFKALRLFGSNDNANIKTYSLRLGTLAGFVKKLLSGIKESFASHNPISSFNSIAIYLSSFGVVVSGITFFVLKEILLMPKAVTHDVKEIHELFANLALIFVVLHIIGVIADKYLFKGETYKLMLRGKMQGVKAEIVWGVVFVCFVATAFFAYGKISAKPSEPTGSVYALYKKECASCHFAYPANLYTKTSWQTMMNGLENHYGEDASITDENRQKIEEFLLANSIENSDSKPALFFADVDISKVETITKSQIYKKKHKGLEGEKTNLADCLACHTDAASGRFALVSIEKPKNSDKNESK